MEQMHFGMVPGKFSLCLVVLKMYFFIMIKKEKFLWVFIKKKNYIFFHSYGEIKLKLKIFFV